jgi:hypothetical protein
MNIVSIIETMNTVSLFQIFTKYEKHRRLLLDDILASIARLPSSKRSLRSYRLNSEEHIQMLTALVLQLIQCVVVLPERFQVEGTEKAQNEGKENEEENKDKLVNVGVVCILLYKNVFLERRVEMRNVFTFMKLLLQLRNYCMKPYTFPHCV